MAIIFGALGYATRTVQNGSSAIAAINDEIPDIMLAELSMPGMSGFELLSIVRYQYPSIRVVAMSGDFTGAAVPEGAAADAFYEKGCHRPHLLLAAVAAMMHPRNASGSSLSRSDATSGIPTNEHDYRAIAADAKT
jgi:CheY-like chemotaxis protein